MCSAANTPIFRPIAISSSESRQLVQPVEGRRLVAFGQRRVVEDGVDEVFDRALQDHHRLAYVQQLRRAFADNVYAQYLFRVAVKDELQAACRVALYLAARDLAVISDADFVGH